MANYALKKQFSAYGNLPHTQSCTEPQNTRYSAMQPLALT